MMSIASSRPEVTAHPNVGSQDNQRGAFSFIVVSVGEKLAIMLWLFARAQTIRKRRTKLAGAGTLSANGTPRK